MKRDSSSSLNEAGNTASPTRFARKKKIKPGYQLATFPKAIEYLQTQGYNKKITSSIDGEEEYEPLPTCGDN
jgi:hypothetical protein